MKTTQITPILFMVSLLATTAVSAQDYPASNFQPKVIFSSEAVVTEQAAASNSATSPCLPKVEQSPVDPKYPASSFQPKVIYSSADVK